MSEKLISEKWLREYLDGYDAKVLEPAALQMLNNFYAELTNAPAVDAEPVRHGHWYLLDDCSNAGVYCSVCHKKVYKESYANQKLKSPYCPNCGAKMDGGKKE